MTDNSIDISALAKIIHTAIGFDESWDDLGDTVGINRSKEAAKNIVRLLKQTPIQPVELPCEHCNGTGYSGHVDAGHLCYTCQGKGATPAQLPERDTSKPAEQQGVFRKFEVHRTDGSSESGGKHYGCEYFVLDVDHDPHAKAALNAYVLSCQLSHPALAKDMATRYGLKPYDRIDRLSEALKEIDELKATEREISDEEKIFGTQKDYVATQLEMALGCFNAAIAEGLYDKMVQEEPELGSLRDLLERRILVAQSHIMAAIEIMNPTTDIEGGKSNG